MIAHLSEFINQSCRSLQSGLSWTRSFSLKKVLIFLCSLLLLSYGIGFFVCQHLFFLTFTRRYDQRKIASYVWLYRKILGESGRKYSRQYQIKLNWMLKQPTELWHIQRPDSFELHAHFLRNPNAKTKNVAILAHGFRGNPLQLAHFVDFYINEMGYHVLLPIARGHSSSDGSLISFGFKEQSDYKIWIQEVLNEFSAESNIVLHGISMGGATVLFTGCDPLAPQVKAIVSDSSFSSLRDALAYQSPTFLNRFMRLALLAVDHRLKTEGDFSLSDVDLLQKISQSALPVLLIHGKQDRIIPEEMVHALYKSCRHPLKNKLSVHGAGHAFSWFISPDLYSQTLKTFLLNTVEIRQQPTDLNALNSITEKKQ